MSVKVHEPVCEDSAQDLYFWFDHFLGDQIKDEWDIVVAGGGTVAVVDAQTGGIARLSAPTNATGDSAVLDWNDIRSLHVDQKVTIEYRVKQNIVGDITILLSLRQGGDDRIEFQYATGGVPAVNWFIKCRDGGIQTLLDSGITGDTDYHIFRIEAFPAGEVHFYIDGVETANSPITTNIPDDAGDFFQPFIFLNTSNTVEKQLDVDYVVVRQER